MRAGVRVEVSEPRAPWRWLRQARGVCGIGLASRGTAQGSDFFTCQATFPGAETLVGLGSREEEDGGSLHAPALSTPNHPPQKGHLGPCRP